MEPCPAEAAGKKLQRGARWIIEPVEIEPAAHQGHRFHSWVILEEDMGDPPPPSGES